MDEQLQQLVILLVQAAMQGDLEAAQYIQQVMQAAQQGDQEAAEIAQIIQAVAQQMQQAQQVRAAKFGAQLNYIRSLRGMCPVGYEMLYFESGGKVCKKCVNKQKMQEGGETPKDAVDAYKKGCKTKKIKKASGGGKSTYKRSGWNDYTGEREDTTFRKVNGKEQIVKIDKTDESGTTTTIPYRNGKPQKSKTNFETISGSHLKRKNKVSKNEGGNKLPKDEPANERYANSRYYSGALDGWKYPNPNNALYEEGYIQEGVPFYANPAQIGRIISNHDGVSDTTYYEVPLAVKIIPRLIRTANNYDPKQRLEYEILNRRFNEVFPNANIKESFISKLIKNSRNSK